MRWKIEFALFFGKNYFLKLGAAAAAIFPGQCNRRVPSFAFQLLPAPAEQKIGLLTQAAPGAAAEYRCGSLDELSDRHSESVKFAFGQLELRVVAQGVRHPLLLKLVAQQPFAP